MKIAATIGAAVLLVTGLAMVGCHHHRGRVVVRGEPAVVYVPEAPPPAIVEVRPARPAPGHIWIEGYWVWGGRRYDWHKGYWAVPPREREVWIAPRYERHERGYRYLPGRWEPQRREEPRGRPRVEARDRDPRDRR